MATWSSATRRGLDLGAIIRHCWEVFKAGRRTIGWSRDENTQNLAERCRWDVDPRNDSRIARQLHRTPWPMGVSRLDKRAWLEDCFDFLPELAVLHPMKHVQGKAVQREMVPGVQYRLRYGLKTLLTVNCVKALPAWLFSDEPLLWSVGFMAQ
jgi:hypothetical protein